MCDAPRQLPDGVHFLRMAQGILNLLTLENGLLDALFQCLIEFADRFFGFLTCRYIDGRADQADNVAVAIEQRCLGGQPYCSGAIRQIDLFFYLFTDAVLHDPPISLHEDARLFLIIQKLQISLADEEFRRFANQFGGAPVGDEHFAFQILGIYDTWDRSSEYLQ